MLPRIGRRYGDDMDSPELDGGDGKSREREEKNGGDALAIKAGQEAKRSHAGAIPVPARHQRRPRRAPGSRKKVTGGVASAASTVHLNYRIAIRPNFEITPKFV